MLNSILDRLGKVLSADTGAAIPLYVTTVSGFAETEAQLSDAARAHLDNLGFVAKSGASCLLVGDHGRFEAGIVVVGDKADNQDFLTAGDVRSKLVPGRYKFISQDDVNLELMMLGWVLGAYHYSRYKSDEASKEIILEVADEALMKSVMRHSEGAYLTRDLVNCPAIDCGPAELEEICKTLSEEFGGHVSVIDGQALIDGFPMVHAVGKAAEEARAPRLIDLRFGDEDHPRLTLVGKGVCFDTGGLNIKPDAAMGLMKKDMGGAAHVLGLAVMLMRADAPLRLRVIIPAVENSISGPAFRPGDILNSRKGISVEIGNTDAEGRLILGDALTYAQEEECDLLIDMATLTGAARVALGPDVIPFYTGSDGLSDSLSFAGADTADPVWRMPLWDGYDSMLSSKIADVNHISKGGFAGSITAALFLRRFVDDPSKWIHFDVYAWSPSSKPAKPEGGEAQTLRALDAMIQSRFS